MEVIHDFNNSLKIEQSQYEKQDELYLKLFGNKPVRIDYKKYPEIQREDIDLIIKNRQGNPIKISEKYRQHDYGDILLEVFSVFPNKHGWSLDSKSDVLAYWFPTRVVLLDIKKIVEIFENNEITKQMHLIDSGKELCSFIINHKTYYFWVVRARNETYYSLSVALKFEHLDKLGINCRVIPLE